MNSSFLTVCIINCPLVCETVIILTTYLIRNISICFLDVPFVVVMSHAILLWIYSLFNNLVNDNLNAYTHERKKGL